ncbi:glycosyltransferase family 2 protein [Actibacterium sp. 188UL27-1]|uniref:glycosyltransferase family 2 protein n=1 Tax=Actibacterium sp. 188UL27-1 TaxID=2786961 RepID=UPI001959C150|nr:glycosyltransferase family 2 protein [Actibacterium sp. 188UL27-1]
MAGQITAIVPTYNRSTYLVEAVQALLSQTRPLHQIIVWNDGSTDETAQVMADITRQNPGRITYHEAANGGKSKALNAAMALATGDYVWICDDDDVALQDAAERMGAVLDTSDAAMVAGSHVRFSVDPKTGEHVLSDTGYWPDLSSGSILRHLLEDIFFFQNAALVRRAAFEEVGPFREDLARSIDYQMFVRLAARFPVQMVNGVLFHQRKHDGPRGSSGASHSASESENVWLHHDRAIFAEFRQSLPLALYESFFDGPAEIVKRAALLQRACVYARRLDWPAAIEDFSEATGISADQGLSTVEQNCIRRALSGKHGCAPAFVSPVAGQLLALRQRGPIGKAIVANLARGAVWRVRMAHLSRDYAEALRVMAFIFRATLAGSKGAISPLVERDKLLPEAYQW